MATNLYEVTKIPESAKMNFNELMDKVFVFKKVIISIFFIKKFQIKNFPSLN